MLSKSFILRLTVLTLLAASPDVTLGQLARPAAEYHSLLNMRFSETGVLSLKGLQLVFPPQGREPMLLTISRSSGEELFRLPLRFESYSSFPVFGELAPIDELGEINLRQAGDFVLTIKIADRAITRLPFTVRDEREGPYEMPKKFLREGPWRDLAYFSVRSDDPSANIDFNWWMSLRELQIGMTNPLVTIRLMRGSREIARSRDPVAPNSIDWQFFTSALIQTRNSGPRYLTLDELTKRDGDYLLIVEANGEPIKSYRVEVKGGQLQRPDQSRLDFEPHVDFISPRLIDTSTSFSSHYPIRDVYWVRRSAVTGTFAQRWDSKTADSNAAGSKPTNQSRN